MNDNDKNVNKPENGDNLLKHLEDAKKNVSAPAGDIVESSVAAVVDPTDSMGHKVRTALTNNAIYVILFILFVGIVAAEPSFLSVTNFSNILQQSATRIILALGIGTILVTKGTDLSLGRQVGLAAVVSASLVQDINYQYRMYPNLPELNIIIPILVAMVLCMIISGINGFVIAKLRVDPFIATLGSMIIVYGLNSIYFDRPPLGATPIGSLSANFRGIATKSVNLGFIQIPVLIIITILTIAVMWFIWNKTTFGKNVFAVGGNREAARVSGINTTVVIITAFALAGLLYGLGGSLEVARIGSATNNTGNMYEMDAIAACIVGGLSFDGGIGKISGIVIGVLIFQVIAYGLNFIGVTPYIQNIIKGLIIIIAVAIDSRKNAVRK
ncbi:MAG: galactose/methyl galactoside ABC transporter permease MglC [Clostridiaceae bacterium]